MMKNHNQKLVLILILSLPVLLLSACGDVDLDLLEMAFEAWAEENGLYENGEYKPQNVVEKAVDDYLGQFTNSDESVQFDGIAVVRDIEQADEIAQEAMAAMDKDKLEEAIKLRPDDWRLREQMGVLRTTETGQGAAADQFDESTELIKEQLQPGVDCVKLRTEQLEYRETLLYDAIKNCDGSTFECNDTYLTQELDFVQERLRYIRETNGTAFCLGY